MAGRIGRPIIMETRNARALAHRWLVERLIATTGPVPIRVVLWNGATLELAPSRGSSCAEVHVRNAWTLLKLLVDPWRHFGDAYAAGAVGVRGDLSGALTSLFVARARGRRRAAPGSAPRGVVRHARANARHHYDVGNDFYRLWLDEQMVYTCAYFERPELSLEQAQAAKLDHVCRKLRLRPGERVVEAGCGWGALARHMAARYDVRVTAFNVSREQIRYARELAHEDGLRDRVTFVEDDFRSISGRYDAFVSVGMLEHVGLRHYRELGRTIDACLAPNGRGLLHFIGRSRRAPLDWWTRKRIFPGAYPPTLAEVASRVLEPWELSVLDVENLRPHYARTLEHWRERFEAAADLVETMFDAAFTRAWRLYLVGSQAAFATGTMQLFQVVFAREAWTGAPWTRADLYDDRAAVSRSASGGYGVDGAA